MLCLAACVRRGEQVSPPLLRGDAARVMDESRGSFGNSKFGVRLSNDCESGRALKTESLVRMGVRTDDCTGVRSIPNSGFLFFSHEKGLAL